MSVHASRTSRGYHAFGIDDSLPGNVTVVVIVIAGRRIGWEVFEADADLTRALGYRVI
jgi:hypothetical protein